MTLTGSESKQLIGRYLQALSGQDKTTAVVDKFVSDATLAEHIRQVEAAFPRYELTADTMVAESNLVGIGRLDDHLSAGEQPHCRTLAAVRHAGIDGATLRARSRGRLAKPSWDV